MAAPAYVVASTPKALPPPLSPSASLSKMPSPTETKHFRILDLPPELRLNIYTYYLGDFTPSLTNPAPTTAITYAAPLLNTCELVRTEAAKLYYARMKEVVPQFVLRSDESSGKADSFLSTQRGDVDWNEYESLKFAARLAHFEVGRAKMAVDREVEMLRKDGYEVEKI